MDESNHGRYPEIFVAVSSVHPEDMKKSKKEIPKRRFRCRSDEQAEKRIKEMLGCRDYMFLLLYEDHANYLGINAPKISAVGQTIAALDNDAKTKVIVDGHGNRDNKKDISHIINQNTSVHHTIQFEPRGDQYFPVVNQADAIAYILYRIYSKIPEGQQGPFDSFRADFKVDMPERKRKKEKYVRPRHPR